MTTAAANGAPVLRLRGVSMSFGGVHAQSDIDIDVAQGERLVILGPNGAGKTTLFNVVAGDLRPTAGTVEIDGLNVEELPARRRPQLGMSRTYQRSRLFAGLTVEENLYLAVLGKEGRRFRFRMGRRDAAYRDRARRAAANVWLEGRLGALTADLSHGEQRQLELGLATVTEPRVLMLDEPASGLSRGERERLTELLLSLEREVTLLLIDHDMDVALRVAERVVVMHDGVKITEGTPDEIRANPQVHDIYLGRGISHE
ncbi:MAG: ATP-binding cassette domain-containing protein [Acidimicrobiia bacterium]|nr:ATP-binding cassette domain-containing protein [Acidimicrobiia bacterium]